MANETVVIELNGHEFTVEVEYSFTKGYPAKVDALPEDCYEGKSDEWIIESLSMVDNAGALHEIDFLVEALTEDVIEALIRNQDE